jgi:esterase/lipase superfamily enzyme
VARTSAIHERVSHEYATTGGFGSTSARTSVAASASAPESAQAAPQPDLEPELRQSREQAERLSELQYEQQSAWRRTQEAQEQRYQSIIRSEQSQAQRTQEAPAGNYAVVRVFYATDRQPTGDPTAAKFYGGDRQIDESLHLGTVDVSIPRDHRMGSIERPTIWKLEFRQDPDKHMVLLSLQPTSEAEFYTELGYKVQSSVNHDAFVFVHGFDNTFEQAALRTAQLSYDLGFQGAAIMYSWPSKGKLAEYSADEATVDWATPHLEHFLETVAAQSHATTVHLIAHSMGNRALTRALSAIAAKRAGIPPPFKHVFLAAPDIDVGVFKQLAATFPSAANDVTLYASSRDEAIVASEKIHQFDRVGDSTHICVVPKIDTIDASAVDTGLIGHAYFGDKRSILTDMFEVMQNGSPPSKRFGMHPATLQEMTYWVLNP